MICVVGMIIVHMLGAMALFGINANAVSLVNLVMVRVLSLFFPSSSLPKVMLFAASLLLFAADGGDCRGILLSHRPLVHCAR